MVAENVTGKARASQVFWQNRFRTKCPLASTLSVTPLFPLSPVSLVLDYGNSLCSAGRPYLKVKPAHLLIHCLLLSCTGPAAWRGAGEGTGRSAWVAQGEAQSPWIVALCVWEPGANRGTSPFPTPWPHSPVFLPSTNATKWTHSMIITHCFPSCFFYLYKDTASWKS